MGADEDGGVFLVKIDFGGLFLLGRSCSHRLMCLFLEQWEDERSELRAYNSTQAAYKRWKEQTLAYYAANAVKCTEPEELDRDERIAKRTEFLEKEYGKSESNE